MFRGSARLVVPTVRLMEKIPWTGAPVELVLVLVLAVDAPINSVFVWLLAGCGWRVRR